jgi:small-conductance mechanosensitive channel
MDIQREIAELRGEVKGFNSSLTKIEAADNRSRKAEAIAIEARHDLQEVKADLEQHKENQSRREDKVQADRVSTRRWLIGVLLSVVGLIVTVLISLFH